MTRLRLSAIRTVRTCLGLTQGALARYLGVSRALVEAAEAGRRELPAVADRRLTNLLALVLATDGPPDAPAPAPAETTPTALATALRSRLRDGRHEAARLRHQLTDWQTRAATARQCLLVVPPLLAALPPPPAAEHERLWLELLAADATAALALYGAPAQAVLAVRLAGLDAEAAAIEQMLTP